MQTDVSIDAHWPIITRYVPIYDDACAMEAARVCSDALDATLATQMCRLRQDQLGAVPVSGFLLASRDAISDDATADIVLDYLCSEQGEQVQMKKCTARNSTRYVNLSDSDSESLRCQGLLISSPFPSFHHICHRWMITNPVET